MKKLILSTLVCGIVFFLLTMILQMVFMGTSYESSLITALETTSSAVAGFLLGIIFYNAK